MHADEIHYEARITADSGVDSGGRCYPLLSMIHLDLQPEVEAQARGLALDRYLQQIVDFRADALNAAEELRLQQNLQQGLREIAAGNTRSAREVFAELREEYDLRG